jgi:hypothetical protein
VLLVMPPLLLLPYEQPQLLQHTVTSAACKDAALQLLLPALAWLCCWWCFDLPSCPPSSRIWTGPATVVGSTYSTQRHLTTLHNFHVAAAAAADTATQPTTPPACLQLPCERFNLAANFATAAAAVDAVIASAAAANATPALAAAVAAAAPAQAAAALTGQTVGLTGDQAVKHVSDNVSDSWVDVGPICVWALLLLLPSLALLCTGGWLCTYAQQCCC